MKKHKLTFSLKALAFLIVLIVVFGQIITAQTYEFKGKVIDKETKEQKLFASISISNSNIGTVTNAEGNFLIKVPDDKSNQNLIVSYIGYKNAEIPLSTLKKGVQNIIEIESKNVKLSTIIATPKEPEEIVRAMLSNLDNKYYTDKAMLEAFYRESIKERRHYQTLAEAVVNIYKAPNRAVFGHDQVNIEKGRKNINTKNIDTLLVKLRGGPRVLMYLDLVKNPSMILNDDYIKFYTYKIENIVSIDNKPHYVISFTQQPYVNFPLYSGKFYVDMEKLALREAIFSMNMINSVEVQRRFLRKKPLFMKFEPKYANYHIKYEEIDGKYMFDYARATINFVCDYKHKLFKNRYTITSEMVVTDRKFDNVQPFEKHQQFYSNQILSENLSSFSDEAFWGNKNIIDPTKDINKAIQKLIKK
ncbi:MAG: hypothetical protein C0599_00910 [Salinivirgaceae bacterium]|nr:MAG: hypothetical protein C0599_00910 [Salinivirgaceae bacterium]